MDEIAQRNRIAWNRAVDEGNEWSIPASKDAVKRARSGDGSIVLTPTLPVPVSWLGDLHGKQLCLLAGGGGQQSAILAALGADVLVVDLSDRQLEQDQSVAKRDGLPIRTLQADMRHVPQLDNESFDLVVQPVSNCFIPDPRPMFREAFRILRPGGRFLLGMNNPHLYLFDEQANAQGEFVLKYPLPTQDFAGKSEQDQAELAAKNEMISFSHTLEMQLGGLFEAGFVLTGYYEDRWEKEPLAQYFSSQYAVLANKPPLSA